MTISSKYKDSVPPKAHLSVSDFNSAKDLVDILKFMDDNPSEYYEYFKWKQEYEVKNSQPTFPLCDLCEKLQGNFEPKQYTNFQEWISDQMICIDPWILPWFKQM